MRCDILTIFPSAVEGYLSVGVLGQAIAQGVLDLRVHDLRRWATNRYGQVDDEPYGGGPGMVLMASVVVGMLTLFYRMGWLPGGWPFRRFKRKGNRNSNNGNGQ